MTTFWERLTVCSLYHIHVRVSLFLFLVISHFCFKGRILILIVYIPGHGLPLSLVMRKPAFCICENKDADQLRGNREADQRLCFRYMDSTIPLLSRSEFSSLYLSYVVAQPGLCGTWSETPKTGFLRTRLPLSFTEQNTAAISASRQKKPCLVP